MPNPEVSAPQRFIPYFDLSRQYQNLSSEIEDALLRFLPKGHYVLGQAVEDFERSFSRYCGAQYGIGVASGTDALILALRSLDIQKGDEIIVPSYTFVATVFAIMHLGATPVFVDIDPTSFTINPVLVEKAITKRTKVILPVHLYGQTADMGPILKIAKKKKLCVIEDSAQAHGAMWKNHKAGSMGSLGCFSFYPTKNLGAFGDGGMIVTQDRKLAEKIQKLRNLGRKTVQEPHTYLGWTSRLDGIQATVLQIKLKYLDQFNNARRRLAQQYLKALASTPLILPLEVENRYHVYHLFVTRVPNKKRSALQSHLTKHGIGTMIHYPQPVHEQPFYRQAFKPKWKLPVTEKICSEILTLPLFPEMEVEELNTVTRSIREFFGN